MCDYCGCHDTKPISELTDEHIRLIELRDTLKAAITQGREISDVYKEFVLLLQMHSAKEEVGLFVQAKTVGILSDQVDVLCEEHGLLNRWLGDGPKGENVQRALDLLVTHIDDEEWDLFPHSMHTLDPEQFDEIELAHRAVEKVFNEFGDAREQS